MRLRRGSEFARLRAEGRRLAKGCLVANWLELPAGSVSRLGVVVGRKVGSAVVRSRAKRLLRESFRQHQHDLRQPVMLVLVARESIRGKAFATVQRDFLAVLRQAKLLKGSS